ncbi:MAG TPA: DUF5715 family protein [Gaiellaceae bacterium]|nr:DUF5715 family protein [Gaiellaceae bacterium]
MAEIVARLPRPRGLAPFLIALAVVVALTLPAGLAVKEWHRATDAKRSHPRPAPVPAPDASAPAEPAAPAKPMPTGVLDAAAAHGLDRDFFFARRGVFATARRVVAWRRLAARAAAHTTVDANLLEAVVYVESSGNAGATAGSRAGLTQLTPAQARSAGLHVNVRRSRALTREIGWWAHHGNYRMARRLARRRAIADRRFRPLAELRATVTLLERATRRLGRSDLAVASLHLGVTGLAGTIARFGAGEPSYAQLYFGSAPNRRQDVYARLTGHGPAAYDFYWHVRAADRVLRLYRGNPRKLEWEDAQQHRKSSAEEVLHPRPAGHEFRTPAQLLSAWRHHRLVRIPGDTRRTHVVVEPLGAMARTYHRPRRLYRGLRRGALGVLLAVAKNVHRLAGGSIHLTSAVRDDRYQAALMQVNANAARTYSTHTTGYTFDIGRATLGRGQERALVWTLNRLTAMNAVAYIVESGCYHVNVSSRAVHELGLIRAAL